MLSLLEKILELLYLKNKFILLNRWLSNNSYSILFLLLYIVVANVFLMTEQFGKIGLFIGVLMYLLIVANVLLYTRVGFSKFDWSRYDIPVIGDQIIVIEDLPSKYDTYMEGAKKGDTYMEGAKKGDNYFVCDVSYRDNDCYLTLRDKDNSLYFNIRVGYLKTKKYWTTKSEIRDKKLKKILKKVK